LAMTRRRVWWCQLWLLLCWWLDEGVVAVFFCGGSCGEAARDTTSAGLRTRSVKVVTKRKRKKAKQTTKKDRTSKQTNAQEKRKHVRASQSPTWYHRVSSSSSGFPKNPPMSAPAKGTPATLIERIMGMDDAMCPQSALLSPVHTAPYLGSTKSSGMFVSRDFTVCVCVCVRARARVCVRVYVCARARVCVCVHAHEFALSFPPASRPTTATPQQGPKKIRVHTFECPRRRPGREQTDARRHPTAS
jgi:hypothetical protein